MVNPENTFFSVKRFIGRKMDEVKEESKQVPYPVSAIAGRFSWQASYLLDHTCPALRQASN